MLRLPPGPLDLSTIPTDAIPGAEQDKTAGKAALAELEPELADLQERLYAERDRTVLLVLQGMDTSGKGGVLKHTLGLLNPQWLRITSFKAPTEDELSHDFLWRIERAVPPPGCIGAFDRSHYEDVLVGRVHAMAPPEEIERRYEAINDFEQRLVEGGTTILKCMLHISPETQKERLLARLDDPEKYWKYNPHDVDERARWPAYRQAYEVALERTDTTLAPWHVVPADRKWARDLAIGRLLLETLEGLDPQWPAADFDIEEQRQRLSTEQPLA